MMFRKMHGRHATIACTCTVHLHDLRKKKKNEFLQNLVSENGEARDQFFHQWQTQILPENYNHTESLLNTQSFVIPCRVTHENDAQAT